MNWQGTQRFGADHGLPVVASVDVCVVGGGAAGVAAAETAARQLRDGTGRAGASIGAGPRGSVLLIERYGFCGGNAVAGLSGTVCGMYLSSEKQRNRPEQVVFGFTERFRAGMAAAGGLTPPQRYGLTWTVTHDPLVWRDVADGFLEDAGVRLLYHALVLGVVIEDETVTGLVVESKAGRGVVAARVVIDASGDGDVVYRAGWDMTRGQDGTVQNPTMIFRLGHVDMGAFLDFWGSDTICSARVSADLAACHGQGYDLPRAKIWVFPTPRAGELLVNATRLIGRDGRELYPGDPEDLTEAELVGRRQVREYARFFRDRIPGCAEAFVNDTGVQAGIRQSRSVVGVDRLANADVVGRRKRPDGVVRSPWPIELHAGEKPKLEWLHDDFYEVPWGALLPAVGENIVVAGRCLAAEHEALASARVTAQCFGYGHAAGIAAARSVIEGRPPRDFSGEEIRTLLNADGARLDG